MRNVGLGFKTPREVRKIEGGGGGGGGGRACSRHSRSGAFTKLWLIIFLGHKHLIVSCRLQKVHMLTKSARSSVM